MLLDAIKQMPAFRRKVSSRRGHFVKWQGYNFRFPIAYRPPLTQTSAHG